MGTLHTITNTVIRFVVVMSLCAMNITGAKGACLIAKGLHTMPVSVEGNACTPATPTVRIASMTGAMFSGSCRMVYDVSRFSVNVLASIADMLDDVKTEKGASWGAASTGETEGDNTMIAAVIRTSAITSKRDRIHQTHTNSIYARAMQQYLYALLYAMIAHYVARIEVGEWEHAVWDGGIHIRGNIDGSAMIPMTVGGFLKGV